MTELVHTQNTLMVGRSERQKCGAGQKWVKEVKITNTYIMEIYSMVTIVNNTILYVKVAKRVDLKNFHQKEIICNHVC